MSFLSVTLPDVEGQNVLLLWGKGNDPQEIESLVGHIKARNCSSVTVENEERLSLAGHHSSVFNVVLSNILRPYEISHTVELLAEIIKVLQPGGLLLANEPASKDPARVAAGFKLAGFVDVKCDISNGVLQCFCSKPNFEIGSSSKLSFGGTAVWSLASSLIDEQIELINEEDLLDEDDLVKPAAESLRVCGTTGKRKACKNCSCGLAEELANEKVETTKSQTTSSCGSCYLGDAFRCASCPYLGMPAFKPGEKIQLSERQLNPDL